MAPLRRMAPPGPDFLARFPCVATASRATASTRVKTCSFGGCKRGLTRRATSGSPPDASAHLSMAVPRAFAACCCHRRPRRDRGDGRRGSCPHPSRGWRRRTPRRAMPASRSDVATAGRQAGYIPTTTDVRLPDGDRPTVRRLRAFPARLRHGAGLLENVHWLLARGADRGAARSARPFPSARDHGAGPARCS